MAVSLEKLVERFSSRGVNITSLALSNYQFDSTLEAANVIVDLP